ncbi:retrovirus-related pol polyprotein from transposon TNT 1-94 [Tanacetum coccineum]
MSNNTANMLALAEETTRSKPEKHLSSVKTEFSALSKWKSRRVSKQSVEAEGRFLKPTLSKIAITSLDFSEALPFAAFAALLVEAVAKLDLVIEEVEELGRESTSLSTPVTPTAGNAPGKSSHANITSKPSEKKVNVHTLFTPGGNGIDVVVPVNSIRAISERFANTAYGFFLGNKDAKITREGHYTCNVRVEYEWKPPRCSSCKIFGHIHKECPKNSGAGEKKTVKKPSQTSRGVPVGPKIGFKLSKRISDPSPKRTTASFPWNSYPDNDDYDPYNDDMYKNHDLSEHLQSICDDLDITVRGRKKK